MFKQQKGVILIIVFLLVVILSISLVYFLDLAITGSRITKSSLYGSQAYYLAEAGINEAIWRIKNNADWLSHFENDANWSINFNRSPALYPNGSYQISIQNTDYAEGRIIVVGLIDLPSGYQAKRLIKVSVFKAKNPNPVKDVGFYSDGTLHLYSSQIDVVGNDEDKLDGSIFTNTDINLTAKSKLNVENKASAVGEIKIIGGSTLIAEIKESTNYPPPPASVEMPMVDFDTTNPGSYKNQATQIYSEEEFNDLLWYNPDLTLTGIIYVVGGVDLKGGQKLTINGVLVADGSINIGKKYTWVKQGIGSRSGDSQLTINQLSGEKSGLFTKNEVNIGFFIEPINIHGLVYANNEINFSSLSSTVNIIGGLVTRQFFGISLWNKITINYNTEIVKQALQQAAFSPIVVVEHWEERY